jgi:hypothetical protein
MKNKRRIWKYAFWFVVVIICVIDFWLLLDSYVDGKYMIEPSGKGVADIYYMRIDSLSIAMFINLGISIFLLILISMKEKDKI